MVDGAVLFPLGVDIMEDVRITQDQRVQSRYRAAVAGTWWGFPV